MTSTQSPSEPRQTPAADASGRHQSALRPRSPGPTCRVPACWPLPLPCRCGPTCSWPQGYIATLISAPAGGDADLLAPGAWRMARGVQFDGWVPGSAGRARRSTGACLAHLVGVPSLTGACQPGSGLAGRGHAGSAPSRRPLEVGMQASPPVLSPRCAALRCDVPPQPSASSCCCAGPPCCRVLIYWLFIY